MGEVTIGSATADAGASTGSAGSAGAMVTTPRSPSSASPSIVARRYQRAALARCQRVVVGVATVVDVATVVTVAGKVLGVGATSMAQSAASLVTRCARPGGRVVGLAANVRISSRV